MCEEWSAIGLTWLLSKRLPSMSLVLFLIGLKAAYNSTPRHHCSYSYSISVMNFDSTRSIISDHIELLTSSANP